MRERVAEAGGDPATVPDVAYRFLRPHDISTMCGVSLKTVYRMVEDGTLPKPVVVGRGLPLKKTRAASVNQAA